MQQTAPLESFPPRVSSCRLRPAAMPSLSSLIVQRQVATIAEVEQAIARQVIHGGDFLTNLLEVAPHAERLVSSAFGESIGLPTAAPGRLPPPEDEALELVPMDLALRALMLPMSVPSHCALMQPAAEKLADFLKNIKLQPGIAPVIQNADVTAFDSPDEIKAALVCQLYRPVRWIETIQALKARGMSTIAECVPGKVLTGLNKRIDGSVQCVALTDTASMRALIEGQAA